MEETKHRERGTLDFRCERDFSHISFLLASLTFYAAAPYRVKERKRKEEERREETKGTKDARWAGRGAIGRWSHPTRLSGDPAAYVQYRTRSHDAVV